MPGDEVLQLRDPLLGLPGMGRQMADRADLRENIHQGGIGGAELLLGLPGGSPLEFPVCGGFAPPAPGLGGVQIQLSGIKC